MKVNWYTSDVLLGEIKKKTIFEIQIFKNKVGHSEII